MMKSSPEMSFRAVSTVGKEGVVPPSAKPLHNSILSASPCWAVSADSRLKQAISSFGCTDQLLYMISRFFHTVSFFIAYGIIEAALHAPGAVFSLLIQSDESDLDVLQVLFPVCCKLYNPCHCFLTSFLRIPAL